MTTQKGIRTVEMEELRRGIAIRMFEKHNMVFTESQFDILLSELPKSSVDYVITFGRSMGADEKLLYFQGKYYQSIFIRFMT